MSHMSNSVEDDRRRAANGSVAGPVYAMLPIVTGDARAEAAALAEDRIQCGWDRLRTAGSPDGLTVLLTTDACRTDNLDAYLFTQALAQYAGLSPHDAERIRQRLRLDTRVEDLASRESER
jgi:hypothetical protein